MKPGPNIQFHAWSAATTASDFYAGGALAGGWVGCVGGAVIGGIAGIESGIVPGAMVGCYAGGRGGAKVGGGAGAGIGFVLGGFNLPGRELFAWPPDQVYNPFKD